MPVTPIPQYQYEGAAANAEVFVAEVTISSAMAAIPANGYRRVLIANTGDVVVEVSPVVAFKFGTGFPLAPGATMTFTYTGGPIYACVESGSTQIRAWLEG